MIEILSEALNELKNGRSVILCIISEKIGSGPRDLGVMMLIKEDGTKVGTIGGGPVEENVYSTAMQMFKEGKLEPKVLKFELTERGKLRQICGGTIKVLLNPIKPKPKLIIFGHGHIGIAINKIAQMVGFDVIIIEKDEKKIDKSEYPSAEILIGEASEIVKKLKIDSNTFIIIATRDAVTDEEILRQIIKMPAAYIGIIGSKYKGITIKNKLIKDGYPENVVNRIRVPMGIDIGADSPEEIAVSVMAEIIKYRRLGPD